MVPENHWGAPRIHGVFLTLDFRVSERTVSRSMRACRPLQLRGTSWKTFLNNHREARAAMDFFAVPTLTFRLLYVPVVIEHDRRTVLHVNVTAHPTAAWVSHQLREAFPLGVAPRFLTINRDAIFSVTVCRVLRHLDVHPVRTSVQRSWHNGVAERWVGTCRREVLDHVIVLGEEQLRRLLREFLDYYHRDRTHPSLGKDPPTTNAVCPAPSPLAKVAALPRIGGIQHRYEWREAV